MGKYSKKRGRRSFRGGGWNSSTSSNASNQSNAPDPNSYSSATTYNEVVNGSLNQQFARTFDQGGKLPNDNAGYVGAQGQLTGKVGGGRKGRKRGGMWGTVAADAVVPFGILAMQQSYKRKPGKTFSMGKMGQMGQMFKMGKTRRMRKSKRRY